MDTTFLPASLGTVLQTANVQSLDADPVAHLVRDLGDGPFAAVLMFVTPMHDFRALMDEMAQAYPETQVVACTTAGEISGAGYSEGEIVAVGLPTDLFSAEILLVQDLQHLVPDQVTEDLVRGRAALARRASEKEHEFGFLLIDGMSQREDELTSALAPGLGLMPLFGGSAGDGHRFQRAYVGLNGQTFEDAAALVLIRTHCPVKVFSLDNLTPTETRMVVTRADTGRRLVQEINAEPAAREYARLLGKDPEQLDTFTFAAHPVVVRFGGTHHVRAIQKVTEEGELMFFSAIDEGLVLTLAEPEDLVEHLGRELGALREGGTLAGIIACDCFLRRVEAQQQQKSFAISRLLQAHNVVGFGTYGEQTDTKHVNQTMTGVAIYYPDDR